MSPPMVNLAMKKPPTVSDEELPEDKKIKPDLEAVTITVETERLRCQRREHQTKRRRRVCGVAIAAVVAMVITGIVLLAIKMHHRHHHRHHHRGGFENDAVVGGDWSGSEESSEESSEDRDGHGRSRHPPRHAWKCPYGKDGINEDVWVDHEHQLIHAKHGHGHHQEPAIHVLHEYNRRLVAYKDIENKKCYITRLDETFQDGYARWQSYETKGRQPRTLHVLTGKKVQLDVLRHVTDIHIYGHCLDTDTYWAVEIKKTMVTATMTTVQV